MRQQSPSIAFDELDVEALRERLRKMSITITQRYCHPQADAIERAFSKLTGAELVNKGGQQQIAQLSPVKPKRAKPSVRRRCGEPPRTRTWNPLIKSQLLYH